MGSSDFVVVAFGDEFDGTNIPISATNVQDCGSLTSGVCASSNNTWFIPAAGTVNTSGTAVTQASGSFFATPWASTPWPNGTGNCASSCTGSISINGVAYTIASVNSATSITLTTSAGTQTGVNYQVGPGNGNAFGGTSSYSNNAAIAYTPVSVSGAKYVTVTRSSNISSQTWSPIVIELTPSGSPAIDSIASQGDSFDATTHNMVPTSVTGSCDASIQIFTGGAYQAVSVPYNFFANYGHFAFAYALCQNSGGIPTWIIVGSDPAAGAQITLFGGSALVNSAASQVGAFLVN
jgi:hypothetical protein